MCFPGRGTHITRDMCFPGVGTHITRDMCFPGREHTSLGILVCVFQVKEHMALGICVSHVGEHISLGISGFPSRGTRVFQVEGPV